MVEQLAYIHSTPILEVVETFCDRFPSPVEELCDVFVETYGDAIINAIELEQTPDYVCQQIGICTDGICNLFPPPTSEQKAKAEGVNFLQMVKPINEAWCVTELQCGCGRSLTAAQALQAVWHSGLDRQLCRVPQPPLRYGKVCWRCGKRSRV